MCNSVPHCVCGDDGCFGTNFEFHRSDPFIIHRLNPDVMDILMIKDRWNEIKDKLKSMFADLSDSDLRYERGKDDRLIGQIQIKLGKSRDEVISLIRSL